MKIKNFFINITRSIKSGISRFASSFVITLAIFFVLSIKTLWYINEDWIWDALNSLVIGLPFSIFFVVLKERLSLKSILFHFLFLIPTIFCYILLKTSIEEEYFFMGYYGIILALGCFTLCLMYCKENSKTLIQGIIRSLCFSFIVSVLLTLGVMLCLWAVETLIISFDSDVYLIALYLIWIVIFTNTFLSYLPKRDEEIILPKLFNSLIVKVTLPIYLILIAILYVYLIKIIATRNMPIGQINWFASFASLFFVFFLFCTKPFEDKLSTLYTKFMGFLIIPIVAMQLIAIYERVSAYGLTTPRTVSLILVGISIIFAVVSIIKKPVEKVWWTVGIIILLFTLVPKINIIDMPKQSQINLLEEYLIKNNMLSEDTIIPNPDVEQKDRERIISAYDYLLDSAGKLPGWLIKGEKKSKVEIFGFEYEAFYYDYIYCDYSNNFTAMDISEYSKMYRIDVYEGKDENGEIENIEYIINDKAYNYDPVILFNELYNKYGKSNYDIAPIQLSETLYLFIQSSNFSYNTNIGALNHYSINGYIFEK